jgi:hypothetical protein
LNDAAPGGFEHNEKGFCRSDLDSVVCGRIPGSAPDIRSRAPQNWVDIFSAGPVKTLFHTPCQPRGAGREIQRDEVDLLCFAPLTRKGWPSASMTGCDARVSRARRRFAIRPSHDRGVPNLQSWEPFAPCGPLSIVACGGATVFD